MTLKKTEKPSLLSLQSSDLPFERITASMIKCYKSCEKLFYYQYIHNFRLPGKPIPLAFGIAFHEGVEAFYDGKDPVATFKKLFIKDGIRDIHKPEIMKKYIESFNDGIALMEYWKENAKALHAVNGMSMNGKSEEKFKVFWPYPDPAGVGQLPVEMSGRFDRIDPKLHQIIEYKTSKKPYKQLDVDDADQASIYNFSYYLLNGVWPTEIFYVVFIKGRKNNPIQVLKTTRTKKSIIETYNMIGDILTEVVAKGREERNYRYGLGFMHNYCDCKLYEKALLL